MIASNKKVVYTFFEKRLVLYIYIYFLRNLKKDGSKYYTIIYPNLNSFSQLNRRATKAFKIQCLLKFSLVSQKFIPPPSNII